MPGIFGAKAVIDLHCHILPGLDDGPAALEESLAIARAAVAAGIDAVVATPHIREDHPFDPALIAVRTRELREALARERIDLRLIEGAEVAISKARALEREALSGLCLGDGPYMLVESPYTYATNVLEETLFDLEVQGFRPVLAHPERAPSFQQEPDRLAALVERGVLCSVTSASMRGTFGGTVRRFTAELFERGLVHDVASDAHDPVRRSIDLVGGFDALEQDLPGMRAQAAWFTDVAPAAIVSGEQLPPPPGLHRPRRTGWRRLTRR